MKPLDYRERRAWQLAAIARGEVPECGREACDRPASPAYIGCGTGVELRYCKECALTINALNQMEICTLEGLGAKFPRPSADAIEVAMFDSMRRAADAEADAIEVVMLDSPRPPRPPPMRSPAATFLLLAGAMGALVPPLPEPEPTDRPLTDADRAAIVRAEERRAAKRARNLRNSGE